MSNKGTATETWTEFRKQMWWWSASVGFEQGMVQQQLGYGSSTPLSSHLPSPAGAKHWPKPTTSWRQGSLADGACRGQSPRAQNRAERAETGLERQSTQRQRNQHTRPRVCIKSSSFCPCTVLTHTPSQPEVYIASPGDGVYVRE